ncbi:MULTISPECIES: hemolysin XhlA family protein [Bacillaceae]|uniref:hemolysin XhlA family protein n=1 Tax=Bacillaceae TaxID=186817 RepID=UPI00080AF4D2|nr:MULTISPECIES: hemolysin XhlA family protein [Bacillaceae]OCA86971.1 hypothetical protein A8L44_06860 [Bacillus sp. FJAT-27986]
MLKQLVMNMLEEFKEYKRQTEGQFDKQDVRFEKHELRMDKQEDRLDQMRSTQIVHDQQIAGILETLKDIKGDTVWLRRTVTAAVIGGTIPAVIGFIVFAIQKLN